MICLNLCLSYKQSDTCCLFTFMLFRSSLILYHLSMAFFAFLLYISVQLVCLAVNSTICVRAACLNHVDHFVLYLILTGYSY